MPFLTYKNNGGLLHKKPTIYLNDFFSFNDNLKTPEIINSEHSLPGIIGLCSVEVNAFNW
jgi:hypothetical protein